MFNSLWPHGLYSPWNSPGQNTGMGSFSILQGIFPTQGSNPGLPHCRQILYQLSHQGSPRILEWVTIPSPVDLPDLGIEPGSLALQANSLPTELWGSPSVRIRKLGKHMKDRNENILCKAVLPTVIYKRWDPKTIYIFHSMREVLFMLW